MLFAVFSLAAFAAPATAGWENWNPMRREVAPARIVWQADFSDVKAYEVEKRDGADGRVAFSGDSVTVEKTNDKGLIVIKAATFDASTNMPLRIFADVGVSSGDYMHAQAYLRAYGNKESFGRCGILERRYFINGGADEMLGTVNTCPGMSYRKYAHYIVKDDGAVTPVIVVSGTPSVTTWKNWTVEDLDAADAKWAGYYESKTAVDHSAERMDEQSFDRLVANDAVDHTARLAKVDGVTRLLIDGKVSVPVAYKSKSAFGDDITLETFAGAAVVRAGVRLVVKTVAMGGTAGMPRRYWTKAGFDVKGAVCDIKNALRIAPDALCILCISCNAYPDFTRVEHPDETWRLKDGTEVCGTFGSCVSTYDDMGIKDTNRWPWVSYASPAWRAAVKDNIRALVGELKRTGLSKRIVGLHLAGYHDGQFNSPYPDYSPAAKAEYERFLNENPPVRYGYEAFSQTLGFRAQEDFARSFKREMGKDVIAIRWCMSPFFRSNDITMFAFSDVIDICVPQPTYETRRPGMAAEMKLPFSSFDLHGKMYWNEFDLRTYGALESWARPGVVATKGLGQSDDFAMWRTVYRKLAGMMLAHRSGYWFYDMGGGWFAPSEIASDIGETYRVAADLITCKPSAWRPSVALVVDELGFSGGMDRIPFSMYLMRSQLKVLAASGVPYEFYLAEDVMRDSTLVDGCKTILFGLFRSMDKRRAELVKALSCKGRTLVFLADTGIEGGADVTGFEVSRSKNAKSHVVVPENGVDDCVRSLMESERRRYVVKDGLSGPRTALLERKGVKVLARYADTGEPALAMRDDGGCRRVYVCEPSGLSPDLFNRLARESGAYVPVAGGGLQVDMDGCFVSVHALRNGTWDFMLPFPCRVANMASGREETAADGVLRLVLSAGETCWFRLEEE